MSTQSEHNSANDCDKCGGGRYRAQTHDSLLVLIVPQVNTCQVTPPAIMRANQTVKYVSAVDTQIKMASVVVSGVVRENTSLTI